MLNRKLVTVSSYLFEFDFIQFRFYPLKKKVKVDKIEELLYMLYRLLFFNNCSVYNFYEIFF